MPYGPVNGLNDLNTYCDRSEYNAGTENFGGRTRNALDRTFRARS